MDALLISRHTEERIDGHGDVSDAGFAESELWTRHTDNILRSKLLFSSLQDDANILELLVVESVLQVELEHHVLSEHVLHACHNILGLLLRQRHYRNEEEKEGMEMFECKGLGATMDDIETRTSMTTAKTSGCKPNYGAIFPRCLYC